MINKEELLLTKVFGSTHLLSLNVFLFFWLAQISTHASVNFYFIFYVCRPLKGVMVPVVRSEDRGNWDKYLGVTKAMQGRLMRKIQSFSRTCRSTNSIPWKSRLFWNKWILQWLKKRKRKKKTWWGYVNFHCMQMSIVMIMLFIFGDDWNDALCWSNFWSRFAEKDFLPSIKKNIKIS